MFTFEFHLTLCVYYICALYVVVYMIVSMCMLYAAVWQIWGCLMNICVAKSGGSQQTVGDLVE